ncbi:MAG TPA: zinc ribbon domain-containing protein [Terracidiphilus sp.]|nr:zinc ribbon domain-containing protein [Terracidiphilus sp.]
MEHPCYRCQSEIPEGTSFCPHCGAPQIRVIPPEGEPPSPPESSPGTPLGAPPQPAAPPAWSQSGGGYPPSGGPPPWQVAPGYPAPPTIHWELAWKSALLCGIGAAVLTAIPVVSVGCCLWMLGAGALAVVFYQKRVPDALVTPGMGMKLGALAGLFGFAAHAIVATISFLTLRTSGDFRDALEKQMQKQMAANPDPKAQQLMREMVDWMSTPQGAATLIVIFLIVMAIVFVVFCGAGGALGASMFGKRREFR